MVKQTYLVAAGVEDVAQHFEGFIHQPAPAGTLEAKVAGAFGLDNSRIKVMRVSARKFITVAQISGHTAMAAFELSPHAKGTQIVATTAGESRLANLFLRTVQQLPAIKRENQQWAEAFATYIAAQKKASGPAMGM